MIKYTTCDNFVNYKTQKYISQHFDMVLAVKSSIVTTCVTKTQL